MKLTKIKSLVAATISLWSVAVLAEPVAYLDWDDVNKMLTNAVCSVYEEYTGQTTLDAGKTYVVQGAVTNETGITVNGTDESPTRLILCDGAELTVKGERQEGGLAVPQGRALVIHGQTAGTGKLDAAGGQYGAGIGGGCNAACGRVTINGGMVTATGGGRSAGIGGGCEGAGGTVTINGGSVTAAGGQYGAGIGGGFQGSGGSVTISGGSVSATGGCAAAGIGNGFQGSGAAVTINGGSVTVIGTVGGAGISGTLSFGDGFAGGVAAGANAESAVYKTTGSYASSHSTAYAAMPQFMLKIPVATGYSYVVSNETSALKSSLASGINTYAVATGATVKVYFTLGEGREWRGDVVNPMTISDVTGDKVIDESQLPKLAEPDELDEIQLWKDGPYFARCNLGATKPEEYGYRFWWGDTIGSTNSGVGDYSAWISVGDGKTSIWFRGDRAPANSTSNKDFATLKAEGWVDAVGNLAAAHDAATVNLGEPWRMPTEAEIRTLTDPTVCKSMWTENYNGTGVNGLLVTGVTAGYTDKSIFLPAAGYCEGGDPSLSNRIWWGEGQFCHYWGATMASTDSGKALLLRFEKDYGFSLNGYFSRYDGLTVRPVRQAPRVTIDEAMMIEPWSTIAVTYTLDGTEAETDYKVAFDVTAGGRTASMTNDAAKLTHGATSAVIDTAALLGSEVADFRAKVRVSLIAVKPGGDELLLASGERELALVPVTNVTLPDVLGCTYVVSNLTFGVELESEGGVAGGVSYKLPVGAKVGIYAVPSEGYVVTSANPYVIDEVTAETTIDTGRLLMAVELDSAVSSAVPQVLTYRGVLTRTGGYAKKTALEMTFRLYDSKDPGKALWARMVRVPVGTNGVFHTELSDGNGSDPDGIGSTLADAMCAVRGVPEIGLTPPDAEELKPRQKLPTSVRAMRAVLAKAADVIRAPAGAFAQGVCVDTAVVGSVKVEPDALSVVFPQNCTPAEAKTREFGGGESEITVRDVNMAPSSLPVGFAQDGLKYTTDSAPCDMILTYEGADGAFNVLLPAGGRIEGADGNVQTVHGTAFGNPQM